MVSLEQLVQEALTEVRQETDGRNVVWKVGASPDWYGDRSMLRLALVNLIANAVKFTRTRSQAERIGARLRLWSRVALGTEIELRVPCRVAH